MSTWRSSPRNEARVLEGVLKRGGGLVFFLGDQVLAERYNRILASPDGCACAAGAVEGAGAPEAQYHFDPLDYRHPLLAVFQGREQAGLLTTPVYKYYRLGLLPNSQAQGGVGIRRRRPGDRRRDDRARARSILVATEGSLSSIDPATKNPWTTMPAWPSFVPLVQEILALAVRVANDGAQRRGRPVDRRRARVRWPRGPR